MSAQPTLRLGSYGEAAKAADVALHTVRLWVTKGHIVAYKVPGKRRLLVDIDAVVAHAEANMRRRFHDLGPDARIVELGENGAVR